MYVKTNIYMHVYVNNIEITYNLHNHVEIKYKLLCSYEMVNANQKTTLCCTYAPKKHATTSNQTSSLLQKQTLAHEHPTNSEPF